MTLPRFTSGKVGKLEFHHLNEAFDLIEGADPSAPRGYQHVLGRVILAKISAHSGSGSNLLGAFNEVSADALPPTAYANVPGGVSSSNGTDIYHAPVVFPVSPVGSVVPLLGHVAANGKLYFRECLAPAAIRVGRITQVANAGTGKWLYTLTECAVTQLNTATIVNGSSTFQALNGCEQTTDVTATREIGVGTIHPATATATRMPIKIDTVVLCIQSGPGWLFSIPNGYTFACT